MSRILVTGSRGLVGSSLVVALRDAGHAIVTFDMRDDGSDIRDADAVRAALAGCDGIVHLAAVSRVGWGEDDPALCNDINIRGTDVLLQAALAAPARPWFLFASSREVYGDPVAFPVPEDAAIQPVNTYGRSKAAGERLVGRAAAEGLRVAIIRLSNVYGTQNDHPDRAVPALLWRAIAGLDLRITGADHFFDFVHVGDCVRGLMLVIDRLSAGAGTRTIHLATGVRTSLGDLAGAVRRIAHSSAALTVAPSRSFDVAGFQGDPARAAAELGWTARIDLAQGLHKLLAIMIARGRPLDAVEMPANRRLRPEDA